MQEFLLNCFLKRGLSFKLLKGIYLFSNKKLKLLQYFSILLTIKKLIHKVGSKDLMKDKVWLLKLLQYSKMDEDWTELSKSPVCD